LLRQDGIGVVDVRLTLQSHDGALIYLTYSGVLDLGVDGYQKFLQGQLPPTIPVHIAPRFQTGHSDFLWMNRIQCVGIGEADMAAARVSYDVYAIR
jgi:hypothetical protein